MKTAKLLVVALFVTSPVIPLLAQQASATAQENATAGSRVNESGGASAHASPTSGQHGVTARGLGAGTSASGSAHGGEEMRPVSGELQGKLDSKTARPGDRVVLKTTDKAKTADGTVIPKGSRLVGHVTEVQRHDSAHAASRMGIVFDRAELKNGQTVDILSRIESVGPRISAMSEAALDSDDSFGAPMGAGGGRAMAGGRAGGGLVGGGGGLVGGAGGVVGGAAGQSSYATGQASAGLASTTGGAVRSTSRIAGDATAGVDAGTHAVAGSTGSLAAHATGFPGVMLAGGASEASSGMFSASKKNIHFDSGTEMQLGIAAAAKP